jgi:hypothetical protein
MGLISLSYLNKIQSFNYWNNVWDSKILYKKYLFLSLFLNKYFNLLFSDYSLNILMRYIIELNFKKGYLLNYYFKKNLFSNYFLGKIWILKYQKSYLIIIKLFSLSNKVLKLKKKNKKWFSYNKNLNLNKIFKNYKYYI